MEIKFTVITKKPKEEVPLDHILIGKQFSKYAGKYEMREISALEGTRAVDILISQNPRLQENPEDIKLEEIRKKQIEIATTLNGEPLVIEDLAKFPNKIWQVLVGANEILNSVSLKEARFLLSPSGQSSRQSIQPLDSTMQSKPSA